MHELITCAPYCDDRLSGLGVARGRISCWLASSPLQQSRTAVRVCEHLQSFWSASGHWNSWKRAWI